jgi:hypothetical protein
LSGDLQRALCSASRATNICDVLEPDIRGSAHAPVVTEAISGASFTGATGLVHHFTDNIADDTSPLGGFIPKRYEYNRQLFQRTIAFAGCELVCDLRPRTAGVRGLQSRDRIQRTAEN